MLNQTHHLSTMEHLTSQCTKSGSTEQYEHAAKLQQSEDVHKDECTYQTDNCQDSCTSQHHSATWDEKQNPRTPTTVSTAAQPANRNNGNTS